VDTPDYESRGQSVPNVHVSASRAQDGKINVTLCNLNPNQPAQVSCELQGAKAAKLSGRVLTAPEINTHNTFEQPENVKPAAFDAFETTDGGFNTTLPSKSVVVLTVEL
jgi:alpha-N-arabinofuranosidase